MKINSDALQQVLIFLTDYYSNKDSIISQISNITLVVQPTLNERKFEYEIRTAFVYGQGCCYAEIGNNKFSTEFVGAPACSSIWKLDNITRLAVADALSAGFEKKASAGVKAVGTIEQKAIIRAEFIAANLQKYAEKNTGTKVMMFGVVKEIAEQLFARSFSVILVETDPSMINTEISGSMVISFENAKFLISQVDLVVATGMTLSNGTFEIIRRLCVKCSKPFFLYSESGAHLSTLLIGSGVTGVFSEYFPFYVFGGDSVMEYFDVNPVSNMVRWEN